MDPFFHFFVSFSGGYVILGELYKKPKIREALLLSLVSVLIDVDHIISPLAYLLSYSFNSTPYIFGVKLVFHNIFTVLVLLLLSAFLLKKEKKTYGYALAVMVFGHLLFDMVSGTGIPLFFPVSKILYVIPYEWKIGLFRSYILDTFGIALAVYFGVVFLMVLLLKRGDTFK